MTDEYTDPDDALLGDCLVEMAAARSAPIAPTDGGEDVDLAQLAQATPYVARVCAILDRLDAVDVMSFSTTLWCARDAASTWHIRGGGDLAGFLGHMLLVASHQRLIHIVEDGPADGLITAGPERALAEVHPLAVWGEAVVPALLGDCDAGLLNLTHRTALAGAMRAVPGLLYQLLVRGPTDLRDVRDALHAESRRKVLHIQPPSRRQLEAHLAAVRGLFVELGLAEWHPDRGGRLGRLEMTPLGVFGFIIWHTELEGPSPMLQALLTDRGYLPCDGGYVNTRDLPVPISPN